MVARRQIKRLNDIQRIDILRDVDALSNQSCRDLCFEIRLTHVGCSKVATNYSAMAVPIGCEERLPVAG